MIPRKDHFEWNQVNNKQNVRVFLVILVFSLLNISYAVSSVPPLPHAINGEVLENGLPYKENLFLGVRIDGSVVASTTIIDGRFGYSPTLKIYPDDPSTPDNEGAQNGDMLSIYINNTFLISFPFESGKITRISVDIGQVLNKAPIAALNDLYWGVSEISMEFDASDSTDIDSEIAEYFWDFSDGTTALGKKVVHRFSEPGEYRITLTVQDDRGAIDVASDTVTVFSLPSPLHESVHDVPTSDIWQSIDLVDIESEIRLRTGEQTQIHAKTFHEDFLPTEENFETIYDIHYFEFESTDVVEWPIHLEFRLPDVEVSIISIHSWVEGAWHKCGNSGYNPIGNKAWALVTRYEFGDGVFLIAEDNETAMNYVSSIWVTPFETGYNITAKVSGSMDSRIYPLNLWVDDELVDTHYLFITEDTEQYSWLTSLEPGNHSIEVNTNQRTFKVKSLMDKILVGILAIVPVIASITTYRKIQVI